MSDPLLFEDTFTITAINAQKYDRVSRLTCTSNDASLTFTLDVNSELYPCAVGESLSLAIASTLSLDGKEDTRASWRKSAWATRLSPMTTTMFATARFTVSRRVPLRILCEAVFVSFGGLLLYLEGPYKKLAPLRIDHVYLLLKK
ncbi:uncharacterized protein N7446_001798 [Penicillium canescens]|uniref:uncharacterized protein n=1 Tax=Penicillium canescens TaxID=5083 RepID=UPI0026E0624E|nr:uncharacterized protein N7446_001798 [Penicillium canescens]KAJ6074021.1 hypothetical protein N7446_001798 [Penicillium canescens]